ncbi:MAG TPA: hypothetical protein VEL76_21105 [Gemmataceae bacterium]|nr:hypothetical protein [Gemmataceae bacterium]
MEYLLLGLVWLLNLGISIWNAYAVGKSWAEAKAAGGWPRVLCWSGAVMSASGFSWCYLFLLALAAYQFEFLDAAQVGVAINLGYLLLIPGILLSGLVITLDSWARAFRQGGFLNYGAAVYNTYAQVHNTYHAITSVGDAFRSVTDYFGGGSRREDRNGSGWVVVVLLVVAALAAGVLTTIFIIWKVAGTTPLPPTPTRQQFEDSARNVEKARR